jgi:hypothetical protein
MTNPHFLGALGVLAGQIHPWLLHQASGGGLDATGALLGREFFKVKEDVHGGERPENWFHADNSRVT